MLARYLREHGKTLVAAATALRVSSPTVNAWVWAQKSPRPDHRLAIEVWTRGAVPVESWETAEERERRERLEGEAA